MKNYEKTAVQIVDAVGGSDNILNITHCMTRLRFTLKNNEQVDDEKVKTIPNVIGVVKKAGQYQVVIGNDVALCFKEIQNLLPLEEKVEITKKNFTLKGWGASILDAISGSIAPIIPVILGCGMVKIILIIFDLMGVSSKYPTYQLLTIIGDAGYYFLPLLLAYSASKKFKCNTPLAMCMVAVLLHPALIALLAEGNTSFLCIPVTSAGYSSTVIPALLSVWLLSKIEPLTDKIFTSWRRTLLKPLVILVVCTPIILIVLAPLGMLIGNVMAAILNFMYAKIGWLTIGVYAAILPFVVMAGMHVAVFPYIFSNLDTLGYDFLQLPAMLAYNFSQAAAAAAVAIKAKDKNLKATATAAAISACVGGITEPALYGVNLKLKRPLIASMIGSGISGLLIGLLGVKAFAFSGPCLLSLPMFASTAYAQNFIFACLAALISIIVTFVLTLVFGWEEDEQPSMFSDNITNMIDIGSPITGDVIPLSCVKDETFAKGMMGQGLAILPTIGSIVAPFDGSVAALFPTKHAIGLKDASGDIELLIHIGIDTVELAGKGYTSFVQAGDMVKRGDTLIQFDIDDIQKAGYDITTPIILTNVKDFSNIQVKEDGEIKTLETIIHMQKREMK